MLNSDDLYRLASEQLALHSTVEAIDDARKPTRTVYKQNKYNIVYCMFIASYF